MADHVLSHKAYGIGVYHHFMVDDVTVRTGIVAPKHLQSSFVSPLAVHLSGRGWVKHVLNDLGVPSAGLGVEVGYVCDTTSAGSEKLPLLL